MWGLERLWRRRVGMFYACMCWAHRNCEEGWHPVISDLPLNANHPPKTGTVGRVPGSVLDSVHRLPREMDSRVRPMLPAAGQGALALGWVLGQRGFGPRRVLESHSSVPMAPRKHLEKIDPQAPHLSRGKWSLVFKK